MKVVADDGTVLDATFSIEERPLSLVYESAGGKTGINARNRDYGAGLTLLLSRLGRLGVVVREVRVDSTVTRRLPPDQRVVALDRYGLPLALGAVADFEDLKRDISTGARLPGAREGASRGGSSRRLRLLIRSPVPAADLETVIAGSGAVPEVDAVHEVIEVAAGGRHGGRRGQGFLLSPAIKDAVERHAMERAIQRYSQDWHVVDVHARESYDLRCERGAAVLHVEVKGTMGSGEAVIITPAELAHARRHHPNTELFVLSDIAVEGNGAAGPPVATGGIVHRYPGWGMDDSRLRALGYLYSLLPTVSNIDTNTCL